MEEKNYDLYKRNSIYSYDTATPTLDQKKAKIIYEQQKILSKYGISKVIETPKKAPNGTCNTRTRGTKNSSIHRNENIQIAKKHSKHKKKSSKKKKSITNEFLKESVINQIYRENENSNYAKDSLISISRITGSHVLSKLSDAFKWMLKALRKPLLFFGGFLLIFIILVSSISFLIQGILGSYASTLEHPSAYFEELAEPEIKKSELYLSYQLNNEYESFQKKIEDEVQKNPSLVIHYKKNSGYSNYNDICAVYMAQSFYSHNKNTSVCYYLDEIWKKTLLHDTFTAMNSYSVKNGILTVSNLSFQEWINKNSILATKEIKEMLNSLNIYMNKPSSSSTNTSGVKVGEVLYDGKVSPFYVYSQVDKLWKNTSYYTTTIGTAGCGPSACAMVISSLTPTKVDPVVIAQWAQSNGKYYVSGQGSTYSLINDACKSYGLNVSQVSRTEKKKILTALSEGKLCIAIMGPGNFTSGGHFIVLRGLNKDGKILIGDSAGNKGKERMSYAWDIDTVLRQIKNISGGGVWIISN